MPLRVKLADMKIEKHFWNGRCGLFPTDHLHFNGLRLRGYLKYVDNLKQQPCLKQGSITLSYRDLVTTFRRLPNSQVCDDINECGLSENGGCHEFRNCINTPVSQAIEPAIVFTTGFEPQNLLCLQGSYHCGPCKEGYTEDGSSGCKLSNPCLVPGYHDCAEVEYCINYEVGEYFCQCPTGFLGNGRECSPDADLDDVPDTQLTIGCDDPPCRVVSCRE